MGWASLATLEQDRLLNWRCRPRGPCFELQLGATRIRKPERDVLLTVRAEHPKSLGEVDSHGFVCGGHDSQADACAFAVTLGLAGK